jgi:hypothetical protein
VSDITVEQIREYIKIHPDVTETLRGDFLTERNVAEWLKNEGKNFAQSFADKRVSQGIRTREEALKENFQNTTRIKEEGLERKYNLKEKALIHSRAKHYTQTQEKVILDSINMETTEEDLSKMLINHDVIAGEYQDKVAQSIMANTSHTPQSGDETRRGIENLDDVKRLAKQDFALYKTEIHEFLSKNNSI